MGRKMIEPSGNGIDVRVRGVARCLRPKNTDSGISSICVASMQPEPVMRQEGLTEGKRCLAAMSTPWFVTNVHAGFWSTLSPFSGTLGRPARHGRGGHHNRHQEGPCACGQDG